MMHTIFVQLRTALKARGVPFECVYGPTPVPPKVGATRIQMLRDYSGGDTLQAPRGRFATPKMFAVRGVGAVVRIHAQSTIAGAQRHDHERLAERVADAVQADLHHIIRAIPTLYAFTRAGLVADETTDGWAGVVYDIGLTVDRGVRDVPWVEDANSEMTMTAQTAHTALDTSDSPAPATALPSASTRIES